MEGDRAVCRRAFFYQLAASVHLYRQREGAVLRPKGKVDHRSYVCARLCKDSGGEGRGGSDQGAEKALHVRRALYLGDPEGNGTGRAGGAGRAGNIGALRMPFQFRKMKTGFFYVWIFGNRKNFPDVQTFFCPSASLKWKEEKVGHGPAM